MNFLYQIKVPRIVNSDLGNLIIDYFTALKFQP